MVRESFCESFRESFRGSKFTSTKASAYTEASVEVTSVEASTNTFVYVTSTSTEDFMKAFTAWKRGSFLGTDDGFCGRR